MRRLEIFFDAATRRSNPGPSGVAVILEDIIDGDEVVYRYEAVEYIGRATNNEAEYQALIKALSMSLSQSMTIGVPREQDDPPVELVSIRSDSKLVVNQALGKYRVRSNLIPLHAAAIQLAQELVGRGIRVEISHIHRENNMQADALVTDLMNRRTHKTRGY